MGATEKKLKHREEVRTSIINAALEIVKREGWPALSIRKIADAIEYSSPVIYDHFTNKDAILLEFTRQGFQKLNHEITKAKKRYNDPEKQIESIAFSYWEFAFDYKEHYQVMYGLGTPSCEMIGRIKEYSKFSQLILESLEELISKSKNPDADPKLKLRTLWSMLHGLICMNMVNERNEEMNNLVLKDMISSFIAGVKN